MSVTHWERENKHLPFITGTWSQSIVFTYQHEMKNPRKFKQVPKQLFNDHFLCFCWIWCNYSLCSTGDTGDHTTSIPSLFIALGSYCHQWASLPLMWNYFKDARILWVSKTICTLKREIVLVVRGIKSQQAGRWSAQFPCTLSGANVVPALSYATGPGAGCKLLGNPSFCEEEAFKVSRWHMDLSPSCSGAPGEALTSPVYELLQEFHIHLAIDQLPGSLTLASRPAPKNSLRLKVFKTFQALSNQYITTFIYRTHASSKDC